jgi:hypothetical protein
LSNSVVIVSGTSEIHSQTFAQALGCEVVKDPVPCAWAFFVGVTPGLKEKVDGFKALGAKTCGYWIGSDSFAALQNPKHRAGIPEFDLHVAVHERICKELASWGVKSEVLYPCARNFVTDGGHPDDKVIGIYAPTPRSNDIYMFDVCKQIAKENPDKRFIFYGATYDELHENCTDSGRMSPEETKDLYSKFSVILRLCQHDGFPVGGIEARIRGLNVIENYPYPGFLFADTIEKVNELLNDEDTHKIDTGPWPAWYREQCHPDTFKEKLECLLSLPSELSPPIPVLEHTSSPSP